MYHIIETKSNNVKDPETGVERYVFPPVTIYMN